VDFIEKLDNLLLSEARLKSALKGFLRKYKNLPSYLVKDTFHDELGRWSGRTITSKTMKTIDNYLKEFDAWNWDHQTLEVSFNDLHNKTQDDMINAYLEWTNPELFYSLVRTGFGSEEEQKARKLAVDRKDVERLFGQLEIFKVGKNEPIVGYMDDGFKLAEGFHRLGIALLHGYKGGDSIDALAELESRLLNLDDRDDPAREIVSFLNSTDGL
jgi:hypothetical protein